MKSGNLQTESRIRPRNLFLITTFGLFVVLGVLEYISSANIADWIDEGNLFLAQCVAIFVTLGVVIYRRTSLRYVLPWFVSALICMWLIAFSFSSYTGHRIVTEADGPASVRYLCSWSNIYSPGNSHERFCVLKSMPLAASNATYYYANNDTNNSAILMFLLWEVTLLGGFAITRVFTHIPYIHQRNKS